MSSKLPHRTRNDLDAKARSKAAELLAARLADAIDLQSQVRHAHWTVKGPNFIGLHELFDKIAEELDPLIDDLAERAAQLGAHVQGTIRAAAKSSSLKEYPLNISSGSEHVAALADALAAFGKLIRASIEKADKLGDADTADLCTQMSRAIDKHLWLVEAHAQSPD